MDVRNNPFMKAKFIDKKKKKIKKEKKKKNCYFVFTGHN
jgi:hypothetical protein